MARVKRSNHRKEKRKRVLKQAKGFYGMKSSAYRIAKQAVDKAGVYAYRDRRQKKRQMRSLWIVRINAAAHAHGISYSRLMNGLHVAGSEVNRKMLAELAVRDDAAFAELVKVAQGALGEAGAAS